MGFTQTHPIMLSIIYTSSVTEVACQVACLSEIVTI